MRVLQIPKWWPVVTQKEFMNQEEEKDSKDIKKYVVMRKN